MSLANRQDQHLELVPLEPHQFSIPHMSGNGHTLTVCNSFRQELRVELRPHRAKAHGPSAVLWLGSEWSRMLTLQMD